jgi:hypothetical protein
MGHHKLKNVSTEARTADCSECGSGVRIVLRNKGYGYKGWQCRSVRAEANKRHRQNHPKVYDLSASRFRATHPQQRRLRLVGPITSEECKREVRQKQRRLQLQRARIRNRQLKYEYLVSHPCIDCGESDPVCLDFDHREPSLKKMAVSTIVGKKSANKLLEEIQKCDVRCANCHRKRHAKERKAA